MCSATIAEAYFLENLQGSPIRRIGFQSWQRNIAVALGNASFDAEIITALEAKLTTASAMVAEHIQWALSQQNERKLMDNKNANARLNARLIRSIEKGLPRDA